MALKWKKEDLKTLAEKKVEMANSTCEALIYAGILRGADLRRHRRGTERRH